MRLLIFLLLLTSYCCFAQKTVQQLETEFLSELVDVHRRVKSVEDQNKNLIEGKYICRGAGRYEKLVVLLYIVLCLTGQNIGGANKGTPMLNWQILVVL